MHSCQLSSPSLRLQAAHDSSVTLRKETLLALAAAATAAVVYTLGTTPYEFWILAWVAPGLLLTPLRWVRPVTATLCGVLFALIMSVGVAHWVAHATLAYFDSNILFATAFAAAVYLIYGGIPYGLATLAYCLCVPHVDARSRAPLGAFIWAASELLRTNLFTGLPWELTGHSQYRNLALIQIADLGGVYAVSFVVALVSTALFDLAADAHSVTRRDAARRLALPAAAVAAVLAYGAVALRQAPVSHVVGERRVAVVQGNVPNEYRWKREHFERTLLAYAQLSGRARSQSPDLIVWPENAVSFYLDHEPGLRPLLSSVASQASEGLVLGAPRVERSGTIHNSAYLLDPSGRLTGVYDKRRLVPFAEYNPFAWMKSENADSGGTYVAGTDSEPLRSAQTRLGTVICYEVLFPQLIRDVVRHGAQLLVNLSNDSWLDRGDGVAPRQHFAMSIFRAVEARRDLVRASASGVSGFVSATGEMSGRIESDVAGASVARVTLHDGETIYVRFGDTWIIAGAAACLLTILLAPARRAV